MIMNDLFRTLVKYSRLIMSGRWFILIVLYSLNKNARIGIYDEADTWAVYLWARNLTDEFYTNNVIMNSDNIGAYVGMPRTVGINFNYNWF